MLHVLFTHATPKRCGICRNGPDVSRRGGRPTDDLGILERGLSMAKLWLTYAWKDNADDDVDHIIAEIRDHWIDVG